MIRRRMLALLVGALTLATCAPMAPLALAAPETAAQRTARYFEAIREEPPLLTAFLRRMPKGGNLHDHLSGAIYAESYIRWAAKDGLCIDRQNLALVAKPDAKPTCSDAGFLPVDRTYEDPALYSALIGALSMRDFVPHLESGHDHFFATFGKFHAASVRNAGAMLAEVAARAAAENTSYLELMEGKGMDAARKLGKAVGWDPDLAHLQEKLLAKGLRSIVPATRHQLDAAEREMRDRLGCATPAPQPGCTTTLRYLASVNRALPPEQVFAQFMLAFELARSDPRILGLNLVAPEDDPRALRDYTLQMQMLQFLGREWPRVKIALHAGELAPGLVPPRDLRFHIREAVEIAGARRIGHGVDIFHENDPQGLLKEMAARRVAVEINLTSNAMILGIAGDRHPFPLYRRAGVPIVLSSDDAGVERINLTHEYRRAAITYGLGYRDLKTLARNSLEYAFLPGDSLWRTVSPFAPVDACADDRLGAPDPMPSCRAFLAGSEHARLQWRLEAAFHDFEAQPWPARAPR
jgi:hypothetical protein